MHRYRLDDCLGGSSPTIHQRAIKRIYGDKANDIIDGLKRNPVVNSYFYSFNYCLSSFKAHILKRTCKFDEISEFICFYICRYVLRTSNQFGLVEFWIFVVVFFWLGQWKKSKQIFQFQHVQINLSRTLMNLKCTGRFRHIFVAFSE